MPDAETGPDADLEALGWRRLRPSQGGSHCDYLWRVRERSEWGLDKLLQTRMCLKCLMKQDEVFWALSILRNIKLKRETI